MEFFLNGAAILLNSANSRNMINHWVQFKDPVSHMYLAGVVVASWSITQRWQVRALLMTNIFVTEYTYEKL